MTMKQVHRGKHKYVPDDPFDRPPGGEDVPFSVEKLRRKKSSYK